MKQFLKTKKFIFILLILILSFFGFCFFQNNHIVVSSHSYSSSHLPQSFKDFKILQISDFHSKQFGENQKHIIKKIKEISPDIIVITGDFIDRRHGKPNASTELIHEAIKIAPIYYVSGNHEAWSGGYDKMKIDLIEAGVTVLDDEAVTHTKNGEKITIIGVKDPDFLTSDYIDGTNTQDIKKYLSTFYGNDTFEILLSHRPELMPIYKENNMDLVFTGHAHGGQFRLPFAGGLFAPDQGFFPDYQAGIYREEDTTMVVSRGLGNSIIPLRLFNQPELVVVTLC